MKKVVMVNAHWSNRGDEAAIRVYLDELLKYRKIISVKILFKDSQEVSWFPDEGKVDYESSKFLPHNIAEWFLAVVTKGGLCNNMEMKKSIKAMCEADVLIYAPGGAVISDRFWWRKQLEYLTPCLCSVLFHIPIFMAAPSMGPYNIEKRYRNFIRRKILSKISNVCVRENISKMYLESIGILDNVSVAIDSAFQNDIDIDANSKILESYSELKEFLQKYSRVVGITITDLSWHVEWNKEERLKDSINKTFEYFIDMLDGSGVGVVLIPQLFGNQNDKELLQKYAVNQNVFILSDRVDAYFQQFLISKLYMVIGMRYHSNIFAAKMGIPFIAIAYEEKMIGFMKMADLEQYLIPLRNLSEEILVEKYEQLICEHNNMVDILKDKCVEWKKIANDTMNGLRDILG